MNVVIPEEQKPNDGNIKKGANGENGQNKEATPIKILRSESAFTKSIGRLR